MKRIVGCAYGVAGKDRKSRENEKVRQSPASRPPGMARSALAGKAIRKAKEGHTMGSVTMSLFYATDFADRLENEMIPALRAGFIVLTDRYIFSLMARAIVRGADPGWIKEVYGFALVPDAICYLRVNVDDLVTRVLQSAGFDYWESGMDLHLGDDMYDSFVEYQNRLLREFDGMAEGYGFEVVDASRSIEEVFDDLKGRISRHLEITVASAPAKIRR